MNGTTTAASEIHAPANDVPMVIGSTASAIGCLALTGTAIIQGYVEGEIRADIVLIATGGTVVGTVVAAEVIVEGEAIDALIFGDRIVLRDGSHVTGEIWHKELVLEAGHMFEGKSRRHDAPRSLAPAEPLHLDDDFE
ncbi:MAG: polymer-forming cytoskeletal protein [Hyphomicrobium sp.]|nr:polymer-forming cytoskeletal protein [Hyphomicrobium sp.]